MDNRISAKDLEDYCAAVLRRGKVDHDEASQVAAALVWAEAKGLVSHGVRLLPVYLKRFGLGLVRSPAAVRVAREGTCWSVLDAGDAFGVVVGNRAVQEALRFASACGIGIVWARNSTHFGVAGYYAWQIARRGMIGCTLSNAAPTMAIWGAAESVLGTNPLALAAPVPGGDPLLLDIATSVVSRQSINVARMRGLPIPHGWALDADGRPTDRPEAAAVLLPFGEHKGSGLALFVELLCGVIGGGAPAGEIGRLFFDFDRPERVSHLVAAIDPLRIIDASAYETRLTRLLDTLRSGRLMKGVERILLPGDREYATEAVRLRQGIPLERPVAEELFTAGDGAGVPRPPLLS